MSRLPSIQILRALAALMVVFHHSVLSIKYFDTAVSRPDAFTGWIGGTGVDLFFLISGFIFCRVAAHRPFRLAEFAKNRFWRIYPNYWIFTSLVILAYLVHPAWNLGSNPYTFQTVASSFLILPQAIKPILNVGWTLEREVIFYAIFALTYALGLKRFLIPLLLALGFAGLFTEDLWNIHLLSPYQLEFAMGAWICSASERVRPLGWKAPLALSVFGVLATAALNDWPGDQHGRELLRLFGPLLSYTPLMIAAINAEPLLQSGGRVVSFAVLIGEASYSLYLSHWFIVSALGKAAYSSGLIHHPALLEPFRFAAVAAAVAFALVYYRYVERRLIALKSQ